MKKGTKASSSSNSNTMRRQSSDNSLQASPHPDHTPHTHINHNPHTHSHPHANSHNHSHNHNQSHNSSSSTAAASTSRLEETIMNESAAKNRGGKSELLERNLNQMVNVLHNRLKDLRAAAELRIQLSNDDPKGDSKTESITAPRIGKDLDDIIPKHKDTKVGHKDNNLVASETVHIDPVKLVVRTKTSTETAKRLESKLENTFGNLANIREMIGKKTKGASSTRDEASRLNEQTKSEAKRQLRLELEKELFGLMENHVSRSILESSLTFKASNVSSNSDSWPIPIKWPMRDPRSQLNSSNSEGEMNTDLLLRYAVERIALPSGEGMFKRFVKAPIVQDYFVHLFWLVKLKMFRHSNEDDEDEAWLVRQMAGLYSKVITAVGSKAKEEYEKDFVFQFLPYVFCNAVYFSFYFLCPGSRHLYTKGFRKTLYMQIVLIMFGIQLCPAAVKASWVQYFPEDTNEDDNKGQDGALLAQAQESLDHADGRICAGESIPVQLAFTGAKRIVEKMNKLTNTKRNTALTATNSTEILPSIEREKRSKFGGVISDSEKTFSQLVATVLSATTAALHPAPSSQPHTPTVDTAPYSFQELPQVLMRQSSEASDVDALTMNMSSGILSPRPVGAADVPQSLRPTKSTAQIVKELGELEPRFRTNLLPLTERPRHYPATISHQIVDRLNARGVSPLIQQFLLSTGSSSSKSMPTVVEEDGLPKDCLDEDALRLRHNMAPPTHSIRRTVPVSWCRAGGADTYHRLQNTLPKDYIDNLASRSAKATRAFKRETALSLVHRNKAVQNVKDKYEKVLASGAQKISRFALDILKQKGATSTVLTTAGSNSMNISAAGNTKGKAAMTASLTDLIAEPQLDESLAYVIATAQLDKEDLLQDFQDIMQ